MSAEPNVAKEVAEDEFARMCEAFDLDLEGLDKKDAEVFETVKGSIVRAMCARRITVDTEGLPTVHLKYPVGSVVELKFKLPTAEHLIAAGDKKAKNVVTQEWKVLSDLTGIPDTVIGRLRNAPDYRNCQSLLKLFLG